MAKKLAEIRCSWSKSGQISHQIHRGYGNSKQDLELVLAPSLFLLISHQLGSLRPTYGLILCSQVLDYFDDKTHLVHPINSALKSASIRFVMTRAGIAITFHPSHGMFANNDSVEEGVRQFINNFIAYVGNMLHGDVVIIVRGYCGAVIGGYVQFLEEELDAGRIGANRDTWSTRFIHHMRSLSVSLASHYGPDFPPDADRQQAASGFHAELQALKPRFEGLCKVMGVME